MSYHSISLMTGPSVRMGLKFIKVIFSKNERVFNLCLIFPLLGFLIFGLNNDSHLFLMGQMNLIKGLRPLQFFFSNVCFYNC